MKETENDGKGRREKKLGERKKLARKEENLGEIWGGYERKKNEKQW